MLLMTPEGKKILVNTNGDTQLYDAPRNPPNTGTAYTSGTDLYAHKARSGNVFFYTYSWSMWQGSEDSYELLSSDQAKDFILEKVQVAGYVHDGIDFDLCEEYFPGIFDEDA